MKLRRWIRLVELLTWLRPKTAFGQSACLAKGKEEAEHKPLILNLPHALYNEGLAEL